MFTVSAALRDRVLTGDIKFTSNLDCIAVIRSSSDGHHGQQTGSSANVEDNNLLPTILYPLNCSFNALVVLHVLIHTYKSRDPR